MLFAVVEAPGIPTSLTEGKDWALLLCVAKWVTVRGLYKELNAGGEMAWGLPERWLARADRDSGSEGDIGGCTRVLRGNVVSPINGSCVNDLKIYVSVTKAAVRGRRG